MGLVRLPSARASLRLRPLPEGVGDLIELAAAVPKRIEEATRLSGESPDEVIEAARFYIREVLLFQSADAYRVLGVEETANASRIKLHYRRLQHWLHPDRRGDEWDSAFAARINDAWGQLRSPKRRAAYDLRRSRALSSQDRRVARRVRVNGWRAVPQADLERRRWLFPAVAVAGCLGAALLLLLRDKPRAPDLELQAEASARAQPTGSAAAPLVPVEDTQARVGALGNAAAGQRARTPGGESMGVVSVPKTQEPKLER